MNASRKKRTKDHNFMQILNRLKARCTSRRSVMAPDDRVLL